MIRGMQRLRRDAEIPSTLVAELEFKDAMADSNSHQSDITGVSTESTHSVANFACSSITLCESWDGGSVGKIWFVLASEMVPGSDVGAPLIDRLCDRGMDFDLPVKDSRALNEPPVVVLAQKTAHDLHSAVRRAHWYLALLRLYSSAI